MELMCARDGLNTSYLSPFCIVLGSARSCACNAKHDKERTSQLRKNLIANIAFRCCLLYRPLHARTVTPSVQRVSQLLSDLI
jgi:hypothetical protein